MAFGRLACAGRLGLLALWVLASVFGSADLRAQTPAPATPGPLNFAGVTPPNWETIRRAALSAIDRQTVQKWVAKAIDEVFVSAAPLPTALAFYGHIGSEMRNPASAAPYKEVLAQLVSDEFLTRYQAAAAATDQKPQAIGVVFLLKTLQVSAPSAQANFVGNLNAFQAVLADPSPAIRAEGAAGLEVVRAAIPAALRAGVIQAVQKAASAETNVVALGRMYTFLTSLGEGAPAPDLAAMVQSLLAILDARLTRIEQQAEWPFPCDANAIVWLMAKSKTINNAQTQAAIVLRAARLLADTAHAYGHQAPPPLVKEDLERTAMIVEEQLIQAFKAKVPAGTVPDPTVTKVMAEWKDTDPTRATKLTEAADKWIGSGSTPGVLNPPQAFGLPVGLGIKRPVPATQTAPAS